MQDRIRGILLDLDGTVYIGNELIPGADKTIEFLRKHDIPFRFVTNTTSKPRSEVSSKLASLGISVPVEDIFTAPAIAASYLKAKGISRCFFLLRPSLMGDLPEVQAVDENPQAVLVGDLGDDFTYNKLNRAFRFIEEGAAFITMAKNRYFRKPDGLYLDVGAFVAALEYASRTEARCIGKPSHTFFQIAADSMDLPLSQIAMIGDDIESDVFGAQDVGLFGIQVQTGKFNREFLTHSEKKPDQILPSLADLPQWLS
ncbi:MAG: TIGR01458 family HAD-type hydrolase [Verrucomicrobiota bacterium]